MHTYMKVAEVRELESYAKAAKDANWRAAMEDEMWGLYADDKWTWLTLLDIAN